ncbi:Alpha/beta hydrolase family protein [Syntrophobacter sp. SbD1]|nr:Alpha/beta hydrolase family protein [Syntrophobacter sp. SbD1]
MSEELLSIPVENGAISLEGLFEEGRTGRNAILCHPHPLFGGNMDNNVIQAARKAFASLGWGTLRYNFRGAGESGGNPAEGQKDAVDLIAISELLRNKSTAGIDIAGYSYGAWAAMEAIRMGLRPDSLILLAPPLDFISFEGLELPDAPALIIVGDRDEYCSIKSLQNWLSKRPKTKLPALEVLKGADHFFWGAEPQLTAKIGVFVKTLKGI